MTDLINSVKKKWIWIKNSRHAASSFHIRKLKVVVIKHTLIKDMTFLQVVKKVYSVYITYDSARFMNGSNIPGKKLKVHR